MSAREQVLSRVRRALRDVAGDEPPAWRSEDDPDPAVAYARGPQPATASLAELFAARCGDYRARIERCGPEADEIAAAVIVACRRHGVSSLAVPAGVPAQWVPGAVTVIGDDPPLSARALDGCDGVLTGCAVAIALTGTIILDAGPGQGRRALTLVPDLHICVVEADQIVAGLPEAIAAVRPAVDARRPLTLISGPSATSDIELKRVEGVHGPRRLEVVLAG